MQSYWCKTKILYLSKNDIYTCGIGIGGTPVGAWGAGDVFFFLEPEFKILLN